MPEQVTRRLTQGEAAVLVIIGEVRSKGSCDLPIDAIAAKAGVCRTTVQNALREAQGRGPVPAPALIRVQPREVPGAKSLTKVVTIVSHEWLAWLKRGASGFKTPLRVPPVTRIFHPTKNHLYKPAASERGQAPQRGFQRSSGEAARTKHVH